MMPESEAERWAKDLMDLAAEREKGAAALALLAEFRRATRDRIFILTLDEVRRERGEKLMDRADAMLGLTRGGEPAERKENA